MAQRTYVERIDELAKKMEQLEAQKKALEQKQKEEERKKRTKRLIELGGIIESVLGRPTVDEDKSRLLNFLKRQEANGKFFSKAMNEKKASGDNNAEG